MEEKSQLEQILGFYSFVDEYTNKGYFIWCFIDNESASHFICQLCKMISNKPVDIGCEKAHIFCLLCINNYINRHNKDDAVRCPVGGHELLNYKNFGISKFIEMQIDKLFVKCFNNKECSFYGPLKSFRTIHNSNECIYTKYICTRCNAELSRYDIIKHDQTCIMKKLSCPLDCGTIVLYKDILAHEQTVCANKKLSCTNCQQAVKRQDYDDHINNKCDQRIIQCRYYQYGCNINMKYNKMEEHLEQFALKHLEMKIDNIEKLAREIIVIKDAIGSNKRKFEDDGKQSSTSKKQRLYDDNNNNNVSTKYIKKHHAINIYKCKFFPNETYEDITWENEELEHSIYINPHIKNLKITNDDDINLPQIEKSKQMFKINKICDGIMITPYLEFIFPGGAKLNINSKITIKNGHYWMYIDEYKKHVYIFRYSYTESQERKNCINGGK